MNEIYRKDPLLTPPACPVTGCNKSGTQCVDISQEVILSPTATVGTVITTCQGNPTVECTTNAEGTACTVTLTQRVCVTIPVTFGVTKTDGEPGILCAKD